MNGENYIRFDWAMKRLLRNKANYVVLEGFLSSLLGKKFKIHRFLESESNQEDEDDKYKQANILVEGEDGQLCIIEVQNCHEITYYHRLRYGASKVITEYINLGKAYGAIRKVYSIYIVYFNLGQGKDYVYHSKTEFVGEHEPHDTLKLSSRQKENFFGIKDKDLESMKTPADLFPEFYILRVNDYNKVATTSLDEWMEFLKTGSISSKATAAGLPEARERLRVDSLSQKDKQAYFRHLEAVRHMKSLFDTSHDEGYQDGLTEGRIEGRAERRAEGKKEKTKEIALKLLALNTPIDIISQSTGLSIEEIKKLNS